MSIINVLPKQVAELIAAGEVVERPSSVIKELVENSIDAGSKIITVEIKNGGVTFMRVTDDGCGIARDDVTTAFLRHATSKVKKQDDLDAIATLGFRGEALAAISSVSRVEMLTKTEAEQVGTIYRSEGGSEATVDDAGCPKGTTIIVRDLFFNTPARMKFLKKDITEGNAVAAVLDRMAMSHPEVSFRFIRDGKPVFNTPGDNKLMSAIYAVEGREFASSLIEVDGEFSGITVKGYVSKPTACKPKRNAQSVFLNGRFVRSGTVCSALEAAYKNSVMVGRYPAAVLHITVPFGAVDINVHPAKTEVRFSDERRIFDAVMFSTRNALLKGDSRPEMSMPTSHKQIRMTADEFRQTVIPEIEKDKNDVLSQYEKLIMNSKNTAAPKNFAQPKTSGGVTYAVYSAEPKKEQKDDIIFGNLSENFSTVSEIEEPVIEPVTKAATVVEQPVQPIEEKKEPEKPISDIEYVGEAFKTYIIVRRDESLYLIDKHAAHERILFNKLKREDGNTPQLLLEPIRVTLGKEEYSVVLDNLELYEKCGFELDDFGDGTVIVRSVPSVLSGEEVSSLIIEAAEALVSKKTIELDRLERIFETMACRAAVKAGNFSSVPELLALAKAVLEDENIMYCPHGRPVAIELKKKEIEKQFGRIQ